MQMLQRLKNSKTLYLAVGTILSTIGGMMLPVDNAMHIEMLQGIQILIATLGVLFVRDGVATSGK